ERHWHRERLAGADEEGDVLRHPRAQPPDECGLADARLARDEHERSAPRRCAAHRLLEQRELALTLEQAFHRNSMLRRSVAQLLFAGVMVCSSCGAENSAGRKFCGGCGAALALVCPSCAAPNEPGVRFCGE